MNPAKRPGRVVMLVDNVIDGDSRVQKHAAAMAEAGWEVHLIGRAPEAVRDDYRIGDAYVHRMPLLRLRAPKSLRQRVARIRYPLKYASGDLARINRRRIKVDWAELEMLSKGDAFRPGTAAAPRIPHSAHLVTKVQGKIRREVVKVRSSQTDAAVEWTGSSGMLDRAEIGFWEATMGDRSWRRLDPLPLRYEYSYRDLIEELDPDLIHAHDFRMVGVAARATVRARLAGRNVRMVYDAHEFVPGLATDKPLHRWLASQVAYEREYIGYADAVVTVSPALADLLVEAHGLTTRPEITLNAPPKMLPEAEETVAAAWRTESGAKDVREACGLDADTPLAVYCGGAAKARCLHTIVASLEYQPELHAAFVVNNLDGEYVASLKEMAERIGAADRVHFMPYVPYYVLVRFLAAADIGIHPLRKGPINHEVALSTKFFEFMQARLPVVVSDVKAMSDEVVRVGNGEVFRSEDARDLARAVGLVLADPEHYTAPYRVPGALDAWTWEAQAEKYVALYERLLAHLD